MTDYFKNLSSLKDGFKNVLTIRNFTKNLILKKSIFRKKIILIKVQTFHSYRIINNILSHLNLINYAKIPLGFEE